MNKKFKVGHVWVLSDNYDRDIMVRVIDIKKKTPLGMFGDMVKFEVVEYDEDFHKEWAKQFWLNISQLDAYKARKAEPLAQLLFGILPRIK